MEIIIEVCFAVWCGQRKYDLRLYDCSEFLWNICESLTLYSQGGLDRASPFVRDGPQGIAQHPGLRFDNNVIFLADDLKAGMAGVQSRLNSGYLQLTQHRGGSKCFGVPNRVPIQPEVETI